MIRMNLSTLFTSHGAPIMLDNEYMPTYIAIVNKKDGTTTTKCLNPSRRRSSSSASAQPLKKRLVGSSSFLPKFRLQTIGGGGQGRRRSSGAQSKLANDSDKDMTYYLPLEVIQGILTYLDYSSLLTLSSTSRYYHRLCQEDRIWNIRFNLDFHPPTANRFELQHRALYRNHRILHRRWMDGHVSTQYLHGHQDSVYCMARLGQHKLISGSRDRTIKVWNLQKTRQGPTKKTEVMTKTTAHDGSVLCLRVSSDGKTMLSGSSDATCILWNLDNFDPVQTLRGHTNGVLDVCMVGDYYVSASRDHTLCVWDARNGNMIHRLYGHHGPVNALDCVGNHQVVSASGDGCLKLWDIKTGKCINTFNDTNNDNGNDMDQQGLACVKCDQTRGLVYSGGQNGKLRIWDIASGQCLATLAGHHGLIRTMDLSQDGTILVTGSYDRTIRVWDLTKRYCRLSFQSGHSSWIFNLLVSRSRIISAGQDKQIMMLDFGKGLSLLDD